MILYYSSGVLDLINLIKFFIDYSTINIEIGNQYDVVIISVIKIYIHFSTKFDWIMYDIISLVNLVNYNAML